MTRLALALIVLAFAAPASAAAGDGGPDRLGWAYLKGFASDGESLAAAPARWDRADWLEAGGVAGAGAGLYFGADVWARKGALRDQSAAGSRAADAGQALGGTYIVPLVAAAYLGGEAVHDAELRRASLAAGESLVFAELAVTAVKYLAGRDRPYVNGDHAVWNGPGSSESRLSFPSGHAAAAFAVAASFSGEYDDRALVAVPAYALASFVALSRVYQSKHWASDIFAGGALGYFTARGVRAAHRGRDARLSWAPTYDGRAAGAAASWRFE